MSELGNNRLQAVKRMLSQIKSRNSMLMMRLFVIGMNAEKVERLVRVLEQSRHVGQW